METQFYQHVERIDSDEVDGILDGEVYIYTKLDGTNTGVHYNSGKVIVNSRKRELSEDKDNAGCLAYVLSQPKFEQFFKEFPNLYLYGEFLVKHTVKSYKDSAWRKLYVFDVVDYSNPENPQYLSYEEYEPLLKKYNIEYIPLIAILNHPSKEDILPYLDKTTFLQSDSKTPGEGLVIKRYDGWKNKYGRTTWAKIVCKEFIVSKKIHREVSQNEIEESIVEKFCTDAFIEKELAKILEDIGIDNWDNKYIGRCLNSVYHELISEEAWHFVKKFKNPKIDFSILCVLVTEKTKNVMRDFFKVRGITLPF